MIRKSEHPALSRVIEKIHAFKGRPRGVKIPRLEYEKAVDDLVAVQRARGLSLWGDEELRILIRGIPAEAADVKEIEVY